MTDISITNNVPSTSNEIQPPSFLNLHPSENPATPLVAPLLDRTNYHSWSRSMITALSAKNKVEFILGTTDPSDTNNSLFSTWHWCNNMVTSWIIHSVSPTIRQSIIWMDSALDIWTDLKNRFSHGDLARISDLQLEAATLSQGDLNVSDFFTKLRIIWDELDNFRTTPTCSCLVKCSCQVPIVLAQRRREDQAMQFLRGLNDQFNNIKYHVLLMDRMPPITKFFSFVMQQERQLSHGTPVVNIRNINNTTQ